MYKLNWKRDPTDIRDIKFSITAPVQLPPKVDLRPLMPPVVDQLNIGSCTGNAIAGSLGYLELKALKTPEVEPEEFSKTYEPISRLFIYYNERAMEGTVNQDAGAVIRDGIKSIATNGFCRESVWPYDESKAFTKPADAAYAEASKHKAIQYSRINDGDLYHMKACLHDGYPFVFGFMVFTSFMGEFTAKTGRVSMPLPHEQCEGGHAVCCVGYDDSMEVVVCRNSWSDKWGSRGYFYLPYNYVSNPQLASDFWTIRK